jgi:predicted DNA-binding helix-hairpin-helix protein
MLFFLKTKQNTVLVVMQKGKVISAILILWILPQIYWYLDICKYCINFSSSSVLKLGSDGIVHLFFYKYYVSGHYPWSSLYLKMQSCL